MGTLGPVAGGRMRRRSGEGLPGNELALRGVVMGYSSYTSVQTRGTYTTKNEPGCKFWTLGVNNVSL